MNISFECSIVERGDLEFYEFRAHRLGVLATLLLQRVFIENVNEDTTFYAESSYSEEMIVHICRDLEKAVLQELSYGTCSSCHRWVGALYCKRCFFGVRGGW